jgi:uncharacterized protein involved in exopolysaccharide biosynthesis
MEEIMSLSPFWLALRRNYRVVLAITVLAGLGGFLLAGVTPPIYEAEADVAIVRSGMTLSLEPKFRTISELDANQALIDQGARRKSLVTIAKGLDLAAQVVKKLYERLDKTERVPDYLLANANISNDGDLIKIRVKADDPGKAALIANTWAEEFETRVNAVYGEITFSSEEIQIQAETAKRDYLQKEAQYVAYLANNSIEQLTRQITQTRQRLNDSLIIENKIDRLLSDATALRKRLSMSTSNASQGDQLAISLLEASAFSTWSNLPVSIQIPISQLSGSSTSTEQLHNLDVLIASLEDRRKSIQSESVASLLRELNTLHAQLQQEQAQRLELSRARDLAQSAYTTLLNKSVEISIVSQTKGTVLRLAVPAVAPRDPSSMNKILITLLASLVGLGLGVVIALVVNGVLKESSS